MQIWQIIVQIWQMANFRQQKKTWAKFWKLPLFFIINFPDLDFYNHYKIQSKIWHFLAKYFIRNQNSLFILKIINKMDFSHFAENRKSHHSNSKLETKVIFSIHKIIFFEGILV